MKALFHLAVCGALLASGAMAQRGGGGHGGGGGMGGGMRGGGMMGGGGRMGGGGMMGGGRGGMMGGSRGGGWGAVGGSRGGSWGAVGGWGRGWGGGWGFRGSRVVVGGCGWGGWCGGWGGWGWGWGGWPAVGWGWPGYGFDSGYVDSSYSYADPSYSGYPAYASQPSVNVIYPPAPAQTSVYVERANPVLREYDQYGQQINGSGGSSVANDSSPVYLIATKDHNIYAALAYSINGSVLQYTTLDHQVRVVQMIQVDRDLTLRLNRERHVSFQMPQ
jgi:hypothetical protein